MNQIYYWLKLFSFFIDNKVQRGQSSFSLACKAVNEGVVEDSEKK